MDWHLALLLIIGLLIILMLSGIPIAFAFLLISTLGVYIWWGGVAGLGQLANSLFSSISSFVLLPLPLFILMGELMFSSGISMNIIETLDSWMGRLPGRLGLIAVGAGTLLSVLTGASSGSVAMLGTELVPEMERRGYKKPMSLGPILGSSGLAIMIPPSGIAILLAAIGRISIGSLLMAIIIPGLLMAGLYTTYITGRCIIQPSIAPAYTIQPKPMIKKIKDTAYYILPIGIVVFLVTGVIFLGIATPSEAAASGVLGVFILVIFYKKLNFEVVKYSFTATAKITIMVMVIIASAQAFSQILASSGGARGLLEFIINLPVSPIVLIFCMEALLLTMGMFMPTVAMMFICLPVFMPIIHTLNFSEIWFGVLFLLSIEMAETSPPYGVNLFVMRTVAPPDTTLGDCYLAAIPFLICDLIALILLTIFPQISLWLVYTMR